MEEVEFKSVINVDEWIIHNIIEQCVLVHEGPKNITMGCRQYIVSY